MKLALSLIVLVPLTSSIAAFAGGGGGGCGKIPQAVEDQELRCFGQVSSGFFSKANFDITISYDSEVPYDQGRAEVVDYLVYDQDRPEKSLGITFHCDEYEGGEITALGKQFIIFGSERFPIEFGSNLRAIENVTISNLRYTAEFSCYLD